MGKTRFYMDSDRIELAFSSRMTFGLIVKGLLELGVPFFHASRLVGTACRLSIPRNIISCISRDGNWDFFLKFQGKFELSLELKDDGRVVISYPAYLDEKPFVQQNKVSLSIVSYIEREVERDRANGKLMPLPGSEVLTYQIIATA